MDKKIGFIGAGNMAQAMISGIVRAELVPSNYIMASNTSYQSLDIVRNKYGILATNSNGEVAQFSDILFLSVKPDKYEHVISEIKDSVKSDSIIVTIAPGIKMNIVEAGFGRRMKVVRTMPNTPALVGAAMTAICNNDMVNEEELHIIVKIFESFGKVEILEERLMDVVPSISGSSPAYTYMFIEALAEGGVLRGLTWEKSYKLAAQAVLGAAKMVLETGEHPAKLRDKVCSAGGTTIASVYSLEKNTFKGTVIDAMERCTEKVIEMSEKK